MKHRRRGPISSLLKAASACSAVSLSLRRRARCWLQRRWRQRRFVLRRHPPQFTGMRRESVAGLRVRNFSPDWGLRGVPVKGGKTRDIPLPTVVRQYLGQYIDNIVAKENDPLTADTPIFWSTYGRRHVGTIWRPMTGKNIWRLCKVYGRLIGYPMLKPHDLRHGVAMEVYSEHHDLEQVRALLGHTRIETTQVYAQIQPHQLKAAVNFYESKALEVLS